MVMHVHMPSCAYHSSACRQGIAIPKDFILTV